MVLPSKDRRIKILILMLQNYGQGEVGISSDCVKMLLPFICVFLIKYNISFPDR